MSIDELILEAVRAKEKFWFVRDFKIIERTASTITLHFMINQNLFVQVFYSLHSGRYNLALIGSTGRLYGRDREQGQWHRHSFEQPYEHEPTPEGMSPQPVHQFLSEVETLLIENDLI